MRNVKNITVAVDPELYRRTRHLAAEYNTSVTNMVRFLLMAMPEALKAARYPGGRPQFGIAAFCAARAVAAAQTPVPLTAAPSVTSASSQILAPIPEQPNSAPNSFPVSQIGPANPVLPSNSYTSCKTVKPTQTA